MATAITKEQQLAIRESVQADNNLHPELKLFFNRILFLITEAKAKECCAGNEYFAKSFGKSTRTIRLWVKILKDLGYITVELTRCGKIVIHRTIQIAQSLLDKIANVIKNKAQKSTAEKPHKEASCQMSCLYSIYSTIDTKKEDLLLRNKSKKERSSKNQRPKNYDEVIELWANKKLAGKARAFWEYNTRRAWNGIRNWKRAAMGWAKKSAFNLAQFKANKAKNKADNDNPYTTDYENIMPETPSSISLDILDLL